MGNSKLKFLFIFVLGLILCGPLLGRLAGHYVSQKIDKLYGTIGAPGDLSEEMFPEEGQFADEWIVSDDGQVLPGQVHAVADSGAVRLTDWNEIAGVAPHQVPQPVAQVQPVPEVPAAQPVPRTEIRLNGDESVTTDLQTSGFGEREDGGQIVMIVAPVRWFAIRSLDEYKEFKKRARGGYPPVNFNKEMLIVLESDSNFPDNIFEIVSADKQDGALIVSYRVNVLGLSKKINSHSVLAVEKTSLPIELKQVL